MVNQSSGHVSLVDRNATARFLDICLRGASQVFFQNNPLTGLFILVGVFWGAAAAGRIQVGIGAVVGVVVGTVVAMLLGSDQTSLRQGMFGFNPILVGVAVPTFLGDHPLVWFYLVIGAAVAHVVMLALSSLLKPYGVSASTGPFVVTTWMLVLAAYRFARVPIGAMGPPTIPHAIQDAAAHVAITPQFLVGTVFRNVAQVYLVNNVITGVLFILALAVSSIRVAAFAILGSSVAIATALLFGANGADIANGLYGFSPVLTAIALGCVFLRPSWKVTIYAVVGTIFTVVAQGAMDVMTTPWGIPTFTMPYVITMWLFTLAKANPQPVAHHDPVLPRS